MTFKWSSNKCMELGLWKVTYHNINHTVLGIYRAPYSPSNKTTDNQFVDEFLNVLAELLPHHNNLVILGDINLHLNQKDRCVRPESVCTWLKTTCE